MKPFLAATIEDVSQLRFPLLASPKLDGIRCLLIESPRTSKRLAASRTLKPIPNLHIRNTLQESALPIGCDGELIIGPTFQDTTSGVMSVAGQPVFTYYVFDLALRSPQASAEYRYKQLLELTSGMNYSWFKPVLQTLVHNLQELDAYEQSTLDLGYEGVMLKIPTGTYKFGRSTFREHGLLKLKRFIDAEARVVGFQELMHNGNMAETNALGHTERSSCAYNLAPGGTLGALEVVDVQSGLTFKIGTGFTAAQRLSIWQQRDSYINKTLTYKYQPVGVKLLPRAPVFLRWREDHKL